MAKKTSAATTLLDAASKQTFTPGEKSDEIDISGDIVTALTESTIIALVPTQYQDVTASVTNLGFQLANAYILPSLSTAIGISINPISAIDMNALALAQIKKKLEDIDKKLDTLLTTEMEVAISNMDDGLFQLEILGNQAYQADVKAKAADAAIEAFSEMYKNATTGYKKVSAFKDKVFCKSLSIYGFIIKTLYDNPTNAFLTFQTANEGLKRYIAEYVHRQVKQIIDEDFSTIKIPRLTWDKKGKKEENQNTLDSLLKPCLPLMWHYIDIFKGDSTNEELLKFLPDGQEDAAKIVLENGQTVQLWKENECLQSDIGFPCTSSILCPKGNCSTIELLLDGVVKKEWGVLAGSKYKKETGLYNGKCHWSQIPVTGRGIWYNKEKNVWEIGYPGDRIREGWIRTVKDVPCPTSDNQFEYKKSGTWLPAPINSVIIKCVQ